MLANPPRQRGQQQKGQQQKGQQQQKGKQKQKNKEDVLYIPPKFFGQRKELQSGNIIIKFPDTFQIPIGVPVNSIFEYIMTDRYEDIERILKLVDKKPKQERETFLEQKLFEGCYLHRDIALYYGDPKAIKDIQQLIYNFFKGRRMQAQADAIKGISISNFTYDVQDSIEETLEDENGETFDDNLEAKSNAIIEMDFKKFYNFLGLNLTKTVQNPKRHENRKQRGGDKTDEETKKDIEITLTEDIDELLEFTQPKDLLEQTEDVTKGGGAYSGKKYTVYLPINTVLNAFQVKWFYKINYSDFNYLTPLQVAAVYGNATSVSQLVGYGSDFKVLTKPLNISLRNFAEKRPNEKRKNEVTFLLEEITNAYDTANADSNFRKMREDYVNDLKEDKRGRLMPYKETLNKVYTKTYQSLKKGISAISSDEKKYRDIGEKDGFEGKEEDITYSDSDNKTTKDSYKLGYQIGKAKAAGTADGQAGVTNPRNQFYTTDPTIPEEIKKAYKDAFEKAKGSNVYKGFKDGVTGKEPNPPGEAFLKFDPDFSSMLQLGKSDQKAIDEYKIAHNLGVQIFYNKIPDLINNARNNGTLDKYDGNKKYTRKDIIKTKPLLGAVLQYPGGNAPPTFSTKTEGENEESFDVEYDKLDLEPKYAPIPTITIDPDITVPTNPAGDIGYGAYIKILYDMGYEEGKPKSAGSKTYRRSRKSKNKTYKKKLGRK